MTDRSPPIDWSKTTFDGSRREQLLHAQRMTVRQRLETLDQLSQLSERMQTMPKEMSEKRLSDSVADSNAEYRAGPNRHEIVLGGCTPTPLANYLKALGVFRLISNRDSSVRGFWRGDRFILHSRLDIEDIEQFFLNDYQPTPIMAPWNAGSGFYFQERKSTEKDPATGKKLKLGIHDQETAATRVVDTVAQSTSRRFEKYRQALRQARSAVKDAGLATAPSAEAKDRFIVQLRGSLPEECLEAIDAGLAVTSEKISYPPLLGSGWNDGNLDFTSNFMQRLLDVLGTADGEAPERSAKWLQGSLFADSAPNLSRNNIGQFAPGRAGGPNAGTGFEDSAAINPWDFVLMIEGALTFAAAAVRRNADDPYGVASYPFTVRAVGAGAGSLGEGDTANARGELWMPIWSKPAIFDEISALMNEGRVALGKRPARDALDFVRAIHCFGGYRGVHSFQRFGLLMRAGRAYLATPLSRVEVSADATSRWIDDLDRHQWLDRFRQFSRGDNAAGRFRMLRKRLEDRLFDLSAREPSKAEAQSLLILLGEIQLALASSSKARDAVRPVPLLSGQWVTAADDGTSAFRIAKALAGLRGVGEEPLPLRAQLFPVQRKYQQWMTSDANEKVRICTGQKGRLTDTLQSLLERRLWLARKLEMCDKPLASPAGVTLDDIDAFLRDDRMDVRVAALLPGLSLCKIPRDVEHGSGSGAVPAAFALLRLSLTPDRVLHSLGLLPETTRMPVPSGLVAQLAAGNAGNRAVQSAWRRLRSSDLSPLFSPSSLPNKESILPQRAAAALLIPLCYGATAALARSVLQPRSNETDHEAA